METIEGKLLDLQKNIGQALLEIQQTGKSEEFGTDIEFLLEHKNGPIGLKGDELKRYFIAQENLENRFGGVALDGGYMSVVSAFEKARNQGQKADPK